jgi:repressor LexA
MPDSDLTPRQSEILRLIQRTVQETGMPPTRKEIADELGFKSANAAEDAYREQLGLPLIGRVAAGSPILAQENIEEHVQIDPSVFHPQPHYLLKVVGMSMKNAGILDGDLVAVHRTPNVRNRQIIVARLENDVTVKRYRQEGPVVWLLPENEDFEPIKVDLKQQAMLIEGVVVGVIRRGKGLGL